MYSNVHLFKPSTVDGGYNIKICCVKNNSVVFVTTFVSFCQYKLKETPRTSATGNFLEKKNAPHYFPVKLISRQGVEVHGASVNIAEMCSCS